MEVEGVGVNVGEGWMGWGGVGGGSRSLRCEVWYRS